MKRLSDEERRQLLETGINEDPDVPVHYYEYPHEVPPTVEAFVAELEATIGLGRPLAADAQLNPFTYDGYRFITEDLADHRARDMLALYHARRHANPPWWDQVPPPEVLCEGVRRYFEQAGARLLRDRLAEQLASLPWLLSLPGVHFSVADAVRRAAADHVRGSVALRKAQARLDQVALGDTQVALADAARRLERRGGPEVLIQWLVLARYRVEQLGEAEVRPELEYGLAKLGYADGSSEKLHSVLVAAQALEILGPAVPRTGWLTSFLNRALVTTNPSPSWGREMWRLLTRDQ